MTPEQQSAVEEALEAFPFWPFNTQPFVRLGTRIIGWLLLVDKVYGTPDRPSFGGHQPRGDIHE